MTHFDARQKNVYETIKKELLDDLDAIKQAIRETGECKVYIPARQLGYSMDCDPVEDQLEYDLKSLFCPDGTNLQVTFYCEDEDFYLLHLEVRSEPNDG